MPADVAIREQLADWIRSPGEVSVEWATGVADSLGSLVGDLHVALMSPPADAIDFVPRLGEAAARIAATFD